MKVSLELTDWFRDSFEPLIADFAARQSLLTDLEELRSPRFIARSILPHVQKLSQLFNRQEGEVDQHYWKQSSNPQNFKLAYFLYFMPCNAFRMASIFGELDRLGYRFPQKSKLKVLEYGAGPASGAAGFLAAQKFLPDPIHPSVWDWALLEQNKSMLELGGEWMSALSTDLYGQSLSARTFHRKWNPEQPLLPTTAPKFDLWLMSYFLNEIQIPPPQMAARLSDAIDKHLEDQGLMVLVEPALKVESRRILELRAELIKIAETKKSFKVLLPCLGHQTCGALAAPQDWCHEEVTWWRPGYIKKIDEMASLDRKTLPFSYLVISKDPRPRAEILPQLGSPSDWESRQRLVSPSHYEGRDQEFFLCGENGKVRARLQMEEKLERGDVLLGVELRGDKNAKRVERISRKL